MCLLLKVSVNLISLPGTKSNIKKDTSSVHSVSEQLNTEVNDVNVVNVHRKTCKYYRKCNVEHLIELSFFHSSNHLF